MAKNNFSKKIFVGLTGKTSKEIIEKINGCKELGIKEASLFIEFLEKPEREEVYASLLITSKIKKIPLVHIRHDMEKSELEFLKKKFKTKYFTLHEINFQHDDILKWKGFYKNLELEMNFDDFVSEKVKVEKIGGFCVDLAHFKCGMEMLNKDFDYVNTRKKNLKYFDCSHLNGWNPETNCDMHTIKDLKNFDYLKTLPKFLFGKTIALETFNSIAEQLEFKKYLSKILQ
jgi:hypothetical protein